MHTKSEQRVIDRLAASRLGWIELHNEPGERRLYLAALGLGHRGELQVTRTRDGVLMIRSAAKVSS